MGHYSNLNVYSRTENWNYRQVSVILYFDVSWLYLCCVNMIVAFCYVPALFQFNSITFLVNFKGSILFVFTIFKVPCLGTSIRRSNVILCIWMCVFMISNLFPFFNFLSLYLRLILMTELSHPELPMKPRLYLFEFRFLK